MSEVRFYIKAKISSNVQTGHALSLQSILNSKGLPRLIYPQKHKQQYRKSPQRRSAIAEKGQRDANHGRQPQHHPNIHDEVEDKNTGHTISIDTTEGRCLPFGKNEESKYEQEKHYEYCTGANEALLLADRAKNEIGVLLGYIF